MYSVCTLNYQLPSFHLANDTLTPHPRERALTKVLNNAPEEHLQLVTKMQKSLKAAQRSSSSLLKEVAVVEARRAREEAKGVVVLHRKDGDSDFINTFLKEINDQVIHSPEFPLTPHPLTPAPITPYP